MEKRYPQLRAAGTESPSAAHPQRALDCHRYRSSDPKCEDRHCNDLARAHKKSSPREGHWGGPLQEESCDRELGRYPTMGEILLGTIYSWVVLDYSLRGR